MDIVTHAVTVIAGTGTRGSAGDGGPASAAQLWFPDGLALDEVNGYIYVADTYNQKVRAIQGSFSQPFPTSQPTRQPSEQPTLQPTGQPSQQPTLQPTRRPTSQPSRQPVSVHGDIRSLHPLPPSDPFIRSLLGETKPC